MDLVILNNFFFSLPFLQTKCFLIDYFTSSKFRININSNLAIYMVPQPQLEIYLDGAAAAQLSIYLDGAAAAELEILKPQ